MHYGFQSTVIHFIDYNKKDLFLCVMSFVKDNLFIANRSITHHGESVITDEEVTPSLENMIV